MGGPRGVVHADLGRDGHAAEGDVARAAPRSHPCRRDSAAASPSASARAPAGRGRRARPRPGCSAPAPGRARPPPRAARRGLRPELVSQERERGRGRVVAGEQQRHRLVSHGARRPAARPVVGGAQQQAEHAPTGIASAPAVVDLRAHDLVERAPGRDRPRQWRPGAAAPSAAGPAPRGSPAKPRTPRPSPARVPRPPPSRAVRATRSAARAPVSTGRSPPPRPPQAPQRRPPPARSSSLPSPPRTPDGTPGATASGSRGGSRHRCSAARRRAAARGPRTGPPATGTRRTR